MLTKDFMHYQIAEWSKYIKISVFCKELGLCNSAVSSFIKYNDKSVAYDKIVLLFNAILKYFKEQGDQDLWNY